MWVDCVCTRVQIVYLMYLVCTACVLCVQVVCLMYNVLCTEFMIITIQVFCICDHRMALNNKNWHLLSYVRVSLESNNTFLWSIKGNYTSCDNG